MNHDPTGRAVHGQAGDTTGQVDTGDRVQEVHTPAAYGVPTRPEGHAGTGDTTPASAWAHDPRVHPWDYWWGHFYRWKRRPRCDESGED